MKINDKVKIYISNADVPATIQVKYNNRVGKITRIELNSNGRLVYFLDIVNDFYFYDNELVSLKKKKNFLPKWF